MESQTPTAKNALERLLQPPQLYAVACIILIGVASFFITASYYEAAERTRAAQTAAVVDSFDAFAGLTLKAEAAIVYDLASDRILYEKQADAQLPLASITKVMLALAVVESLPLESRIVIPYDTRGEGSTQRLAAGETWPLTDVINFTLITSSNRGADILAAAAHEAVRERFENAPVEDATIWRMNTLAAEIGMQQSYFLNASGLDVSSTQSGGYASARDVARLFAHAASTRLPVFSATAENGVLLVGGGETAEAVNTNEALDDIPGLLMGKTGYTDLAGGNLAVVYDVGLAHPLVAVILGSTREGRFEDMRALVAASRRAIIR
jgi:D-alanyl-D-alanine carboxypeptidase